LYSLSDCHPGENVLQPTSGSMLKASNKWEAV
jgi:hypothetical protein